jgi:hypothetical protein
MVKIKRRLSEHEEFKIMGLVLDKFLWLGTVFAGLGLYNIVVGRPSEGVMFIASGIVFAALFGWLVVREFEQMR